ncbi:pyridoxamine 5'-phosphate oxidase family protein [Cognatishimia activa]|uniref:pyridoxamine 5'-phosphate oxidase family protein n=1 Tax=Cognatishimia activa TaxID=1715691 RepID=UPI00222E4BCA|nr:pyridoxamine 5'-phosphate oxidase family protein [Cognatishimia activa]UZD90956.1 pyridoxamine 5'-phosphate oxidase family protein [Cognatishimia activa]
MKNYAEMMFSEAVSDLQKKDGSYDKYQAGYRHRTQDGFEPQDVAFIQSRESFYIASTSPDGWPYVQHRGGPQGFLNVTGPSQIACLDYKGNRQFITMGHLKTDDRVSLFLMDYMQRARLKLQGHATLKSLEEADPALVKQLDPTGKPAERLLVIDVVAMDWNCPKYIPQMFTKPVVETLLARGLDDLQKENEQLRARLAELGVGEA